MGLYLAIFDECEELEGVDIGLYSDFDAFRNAVIQFLEPGGAGSRYPTLILHSDCDGEWSPSESQLLVAELMAISDGFRQLPPILLNSDWKKEVAKTMRLSPACLYDCFYDVDGEPLLQRLIELAQLSVARGLPIVFQ